MSDLDEQDAERAQLTIDRGEIERLYGGRRTDRPSWHPEDCDCHACWQPPERIDRQDAHHNHHTTYTPWDFHD
mgnify:CR=1 FL=1